RHLRELPADGRDDARRPRVSRGPPAPREEHRRLGRRVGEQPAAGRPAASRSAARDADVRTEPCALDGQRRDDRGGWSAETPGGRARASRSQRRRCPGAMKVHTDYLWFNTKKRQEFIRITDEVASIVAASGVQEGTVLVSAMHITAGVYVNDWEDGLINDFQVWL